MLKQKPHSFRYDALDALRGIAAVGVLATHCLQLFVSDGVLNHTPLRMFVNGRSFVIFFFVLSGFVLATSIWNQRDSGSYLNYAASRAARLYPPYLVAGILGFLITAIVGNSDWVALREYVLTSGTEVGRLLNIPSWSLVYELRLSFLMPLISIMIARNLTFAMALTLVLFVAEETALITTGIGQYAYGGETPIEALVTTVHFGISFVVGALLANDWQSRRIVFSTISKHPIFAAGFAYLLMSVLLDQLSMVGAALLIVLAMQSGRLKTALSVPVLQWLGRISFSLYLTHFLLLKVLDIVLGDVLPPIAVSAIGFSTAFLVAEMFYRCVEKPCINLSRRVRSYGNSSLPLNAAKSGERFS